LVHLSHVGLIGGSGREGRGVCLGCPGSTSRRGARKLTLFYSIFVHLTHQLIFYREEAKEDEEKEGVELEEEKEGKKPKKLRSRGQFKKLER
jgi:hypothetical protein